MPHTGFLPRHPPLFSLHLLPKNTPGFHLLRCVHTSHITRCRLLPQVPSKSYGGHCALAACVVSSLAPTSHDCPPVPLSSTLDSSNYNFLTQTTSSPRYIRISLPETTVKAEYRRQNTATYAVSNIAIHQPTTLPVINASAHLALPSPTTTSSIASCNLEPTIESRKI